MFFVFGWGRQTNKDLGPTLPVMCPNCKNEGFWHYHQSQLWFTLFFLPVFPYQSKHLRLCEVCSRGVELTGDKVAHAKALNLAATAYFAQTMSEDQFRSAVDESRMLS
jgi:hypothetical protein